MITEGAMLSDFALAYCSGKAICVPVNDSEPTETYCHQQVVVPANNWTHRPPDERSGLVLDEAGWVWGRLRCALTPNYQWRENDAVSPAHTSRDAGSRLLLSSSHHHTHWGVLCRTPVSGAACTRLGTRLERLTDCWHPHVQ